MSTVDIDKAGLVDEVIGLVRAISGDDHAKFHPDGYANKILALFINEKASLKAELLAKMPKKQSTKNCLRPAIPEAYNQALTEITKIIEEM